MERIYVFMKKFTILILTLIGFYFNTYAEEVEIITEEDKIEIEDALIQARNINKITSLEGAASIKYDNIYLKNNPTTLNNLIHDPAFRYSVGFKTKLGGRATTSVDLIMNNPLSGDPNQHEIDLGEDAFICNLQIMGAGSIYNIILGGPTYDYGCSPLTAGNPKSEGGNFAFERIPWGDPEAPASYYYRIYENVGYVEETRANPGVKGIGTKSSFAPIKANITAFLGKTSGNYKNATWLWFGKLERKIFSHTIGFNYRGNVFNSQNTEKNDMEFNIYSFRSQKEYPQLFDYDIEIAYCKAKKPKEAKKSDGTAFLGTISKDLNINLIILSLVNSKIRICHTSSGFIGTNNAIYNAKPVFQGDAYRPVYVSETINDLYSNRTSIYFVNLFHFLMGKVKLTLGQAKDLNNTKDELRLQQHLNHRIWHKLVGNFNKPYDLVMDWIEYEGAYQLFEYTEKDHPSVTNSSKTYPLFRIDLSYKLSDWVDIGYPLYYFSRIIKSGISKADYAFPLPSHNNSWFPFPTTHDPDRLLEYDYYDHFFALGLSQRLFLITFFSRERYLVPQKHLDLDRINYGKGIGADWFFSGGLGMYLKITQFRHVNKYDTEFNFMGYTYSIEFIKSFSY